MFNRYVRTVWDFQEPGNNRRSFCDAVYSLNVCPQTLGRLQSPIWSIQCDPIYTTVKFLQNHYDVIKWKHFPRWLLAICAENSPVPVNSLHKGQRREAVMFSLICARINDWENNREAGDLRRQRGHYDVSVMYLRLHSLTSATFIGISCYIWLRYNGPYCSGCIWCWNTWTIFHIIGWPCGFAVQNGT